jgi:hypothetical protein
VRTPGSSLAGLRWHQSVGRAILAGINFANENERADSEKERALISTRTRQALAAAKARRVSLGDPKLSVARKSAVQALIMEADRFRANVLPIIREAQKAGARTLREIAAALNARGVATAPGRWHAKSVANDLERA